jgi:hypothetical protein
MAKVKKIVKQESSKPTPVTSKTFYRVELTDRFLLGIKGKSKAERKLLEEAINTARDAWGQPHLHRGCGIRHLHKSFYGSGSHAVPPGRQPQRYSPIHQALALTWFLNEKTTSLTQRLFPGTPPTINHQTTSRDHLRFITRQIKSRCRDFVRTSHSSRQLRG